MSFRSSLTDCNAGWRIVTLSPGEQAVINGALVMADSTCDLRIGGAASVLTGARAQPRGSAHAVADELYYATLERRALPHAAESSAEVLFDLLGKTVAVLRTNEAQRLCAGYAAALIDRDFESALAAARALAEEASRLPHRPGISPALRTNA